MDIGKRLRNSASPRGSPRKSWQTVVNCPRDLFSQLERDLTSPSIATLMDILQCLGTTVSVIFSGRAGRSIVFRNEDYFEKIDSELGSKTEWIIPNAQKNMMEPIRLTLKPGGLTLPGIFHMKVKNLVMY